MKKSPLRQAAKVLGVGLIGGLVAPTAAVAVQAFLGEAITLADWLPATEHRGEPRHAMGGTPQQALLSTGTAPTSFTSAWTIDYPTPMAEVLLLNDSLKAMSRHNRIVLNTAGLVLEPIIKDRPPRI